MPWCCSSPLQHPCYPHPHPPVGGRGSSQTTSCRNSHPGDQCFPPWKWPCSSETCWLHSSYFRRNENFEPGKLMWSHVFMWLYWHFNMCLASLVTQLVKNLPAVQETRVWPLGQEDSLEKGVAAYSSILALRSPWTEETGRLLSMGSQRVRHDWTTNTFTFPGNLTLGSDLMAVGRGYSISATVGRYSASKASRWNVSAILCLVLDPLLPKTRLKRKFSQWNDLLYLCHSVELRHHHSQLWWRWLYLALLSITKRI